MIETILHRGDIESREEFVLRNIAWWRKYCDQERRNRQPTYEHFLDVCGLRREDCEGKIVGEVGPGPFGGIIEVCRLPAAQKVFIDYIMKELYDLHFINWPEGVYVSAPLWHIPEDAAHQHSRGISLRRGVPCVA